MEPVSNDSSGFEWDIRDDIIVYYFRDSRRDAIDTWVRMTRQHREEFLAQGKPVRRLWYFDDGVMPTPYAVQRSVQLARETPDSIVKHQVACVVKNHRIFTLIRYVFSKIDARKDYIRFFNEESSALEWLSST